MADPSGYNNSLEDDGLVVRVEAQLTESTD
jgi:hypothetical protein